MINNKIWWLIGRFAVNEVYEMLFGFV